MTEDPAILGLRVNWKQFTQVDINNASKGSLVRIQVVHDNGSH